MIKTTADGRCFDSGDCGAIAMPHQSKLVGLPHFFYPDDYCTIAATRPGKLIGLLHFFYPDDYYTLALPRPGKLIDLCHFLAQIISRKDRLGDIPKR